MPEISMQELEAQHGELLPEREALGCFGRHSFHFGIWGHDCGHHHGHTYGHGRDDCHGHGESHHGHHGHHGGDGDCDGS
jgi:hypothetical protein